MSENALPHDGTASLSDWRRLAAVVELARDAILVAATDGRIVLFNAAAGRMFGCLEPAALGRTLQHFLPAIDPQTGRVTTAGQDAGRMARTGAATLVIARRNDGAEFPADVVVSPLEHAGSIECMVTVRDVAVCRQPADRDLVTSTRGITGYEPGVHDPEQIWSTVNGGRAYHWPLTDSPTGVNQLQNGLTDVVDPAGDAMYRVGGGAALRYLNDCLERQAKAIAQMLHDEAGQLLTSAFIALAQAKRQLPSSCHEHLQQVKAHLDGIEDQLRRIAHELRPQILDDLGFLPALQFLADSAARRSGFAVSFAGSVNGHLPALVEATLYRLVQEALSNARRHASARHVTIRVEHDHQRVRCTVADDGVGFDASVLSNPPESDGMGLASIRDRIQSLSGTFNIETIPGRGTQLIATIPADR